MIRTADSGARPHKADASVKITMQMIRKRLRPMYLPIQLVAGRIIALEMR